MTAKNERFRSGRREFLIAALASNLAMVMHGNPASAVEVTHGVVMLPDGRHLGYASYGDRGGLPVLYFHGTPSSRLEAQLVAQLCREHRVRLISVDRSGMGLSTYSCNHSVAGWPKDIETLLDFLRQDRQFSRIGVLAFSGGTPFALACAEELPEQIFGAAILSPRTPGAPGVASGVLDRDIYFVRNRPRLAGWVLDRQIRRLRRRPDRARSPQIDRLAYVDQQFAARHAQWLRQSILEAARCGTAGIVRDISLLPWPWCINLSKIRVPVACWQGSCDYSAPEETSHFLRRQIPNSSVAIVKGHGHFTLLSSLAGEALDWLRSAST